MIKMIEERLTIEQGKQLIEGEHAEHIEVFAEKIQLTCDISVMAMQDEHGKQSYSVNLCFALNEDEGDYEAIATLAYNRSQENEVISLDEVARLLGIDPKAQIWVSEQ